jgi:hypothetical protein
VSCFVSFSAGDAELGAAVATGIRVLERVVNEPAAADAGAEAESRRRIENADVFVAVVTQNWLADAVSSCALC